MAEVAPAELKHAIESQHGGTATFVQSVPIQEVFGGKVVWDGTVAVFDLADSPSGAKRAYAWSYERDDGRRRFFAVLHMGPIIGPREAVRAAIVAEDQARVQRETVEDTRPTCIHCGRKFGVNEGVVKGGIAVCDMCLGD